MPYAPHVNARVTWPSERPFSLSTLQDVAIFPLPDVALFPNADVPLHIFEPRYRTMLSDCLRLEIDAAAGLSIPSVAHELITVVRLRPGFERDYEGRPPIFRTGCLTRIQSWKQIEDGRFNITLRGLDRVLIDELPADDRPYRRGAMTVVEPIVGDIAETAESRALANELYATASGTLKRLRALGQNVSLPFSQNDEPGVIADVSASAFAIDPDLRQELLEEHNPLIRLRQLVSILNDVFRAVSEKQTFKDAN